uniref:Uncharacterized protein n=1 Tax=Arundo donax TaxID=35708 RepID=A0A0A9D107_ARUDO
MNWTPPTQVKHVGITLWMCTNPTAANFPPRRRPSSSRLFLRLDQDWPEDDPEDQDYTAEQGVNDEDPCMLYFP